MAADELPGEGGSDRPHDNLGGNHDDGANEEGTTTTKLLNSPQAGEGRSDVDGREDDLNEEAVANSRRSKELGLWGDRDGKVYGGRDDRIGKEAERWRDKRVERGKAERASVFCLFMKLEFLHVPRKRSRS